MMDSNIRPLERELKLSVKDGQQVRSSFGTIDPRLFNGENRLRVTMDPQTTLWSFSYESGGIPEPLKERFTSFAKALSHANSYYKTRNIIVKEV